MSEQTFYGEWTSDAPISPAMGSIWEVELERDDGYRFIQTAVAAGDLIDALGLLDNQPERQLRFRRVYPPGSVLPEPRLASTIDPTAFNRWPMWCWRLPNETMWTTTPVRKSECECFMCKNGKDYECYPVQQLANGAFVAVPWSAVEGGK